MASPRSRFPRPRAAALAIVVALAAGAPQAHASGLYVALGDSVAAGGGASDQVRGGYVARLFGILGRPEGGSLSEWANLGQYGADSGSLRGAQLSQATADIDAASDTRVVTIDIGGNDRFQCAGGWYLSSCPFAGNFAATLNDLQAALARDPGAEELVAMAYYNPASGLGPPDEPSYDRGLLGSDLAIDCGQSGDRLGLNDLIFCIAGAHGALVADAYPPFKAKGQAFMGDPEHPSDLGHAAIARQFCLALESVPDAACPADPGPLPAPVSPDRPASPDHAGPRIAVAGLRGTRGRCARHSFVVRIRARDASGIRRARVYVDGRRIRSTHAARFRVRVRAARLRPGRHRLTVIARDRAGNRSRRSLRFRRCRR